MMAYSIIISTGLCLLVIGSTLAALPPYVKTCSRHDPNLSQCFNQTLYSLFPMLQNGIPEMHLPTFEPLDAGEVALVDLTNFHAVATDLKIGWILQLQMKYLNVDLKKRLIDYVIYFRQLNLSSPFDVRAQIFVPIHEKGPITIIADDVDLMVNHTFDVVEDRGLKKMVITSAIATMNIKDYTASYKPGDNSYRSAAINAILRDNRYDIIENITPSLEKDLAQIIMNVSNGMLTNYAYDDLFPDKA